MVADHFSIQGQGDGQGTGLLLQPVCQQRGEGLWVHPAEDLVEDTVTGHLAEGLGAFLQGQSQFGALGLA